MENLIQPASVLDQQRPVQPFLMPNLLHLCNAGMLIALFCDHTGGVTGSHITEYEHCEGYKQNHTTGTMARIRLKMYFPTRSSYTPVSWIMLPLCAR